MTPVKLSTCGIAVVLSLTALEAATLESSKFRVEFDDATRAVVAFTDKARSDRQVVSVTEDFSFVVNAGSGDNTVSSSTSTIASATLAGNSYTVVSNNAQGTVTVAYTMGISGHYVTKNIRFVPSFAGAYTLKRIKTFVFTPSGAPPRVVHQHGDGGYTFFLRKTANSFFAAVQVIPGIPISTNAGNPLELQYDANIKLTGVYDAETSVIGCATRTGHAYSIGVNSLHRCPTSATGLDDGEAEAMVALIADMAPNRHTAPITIHLNGWQSGITITESSYGDQGFRNTLITARDSLLGPDFYFTSAYPWFGHKARMPGMSPADIAVPYSGADERDFLTWLRNNRIKSLLWTVTAHASINPAEPRYCQSYEPFRLPGTDENCIADATFMAWLTTININEIKKGHEGWSHDEEGASNNYSTYTCSATNHSHVAGANASYGCFHERKKIWKKLRADFGEDFELWNNRQEADTGPWEWLDLTTVCTYGENREWNDSPAKIRMCARGRHFYHFCPSWMHQVIIYPNSSGSDLDKLMLSALAVSSSYLFGDGVNVPNRSRIKYWLDWARSHAAFMRGQSVYLPKWPAEGVDGYVRSSGGSAYVFIFNDYGSTASITVPLDATVGLNASTTYTVSQVFPSQAGTSTAQGSTTISLNNGQYRLLYVSQPGAPVITQDPLTQRVSEGSQVRFTVAASGSGALAYQWKKDGAVIGRATSATYTIGSAAQNDAGSYTCTVTNSQGNATSAAAILTVTAPVICTAGTIFTNQTPSGSNNDTRYELGTRFGATCAGIITAVRIYANAAEGGDHSVRIWNVSSSSIVSGPHTWSFVAGQAGWKEFALPSALPVSAGTDYMVAVSNSSDNNYASTSGGFSEPIENGSLVTYVGSGLYSTTLGSMPSQPYGNTNYFRDVRFVPAVTNQRSGQLPRGNASPSTTVTASGVSAMGAGPWSVSVVNVRGQVVVRGDFDGPGTMSLRPLAHGAYTVLVSRQGHLTRMRVFCF